MKRLKDYSHHAQTSAPKAGGISSSQSKLWEFHSAPDSVAKKAIWDDAKPVKEIPPLPKRPSLEVGSALPLPDLVECYKKWVLCPAYMLFYRLTRIPDDENHYHEWFNEIIAVKASKRGNDVYGYHLRKRLEWATDDLFNGVDLLHGSNRELRSNLLYITLTYDRDRISLKDAWLRVGYDLNRYDAYLRSHFGCKVSTFRGFEAQRDGYPHIHVLAFFTGYSFSLFRYKDKLRVRLKDELEWEYGFTDVTAVDNLGKGLRYVLKYPVKSADAHHDRTDKEWLTLALTWIYRKRLYGFSGKFQSSVTDLIRYMCNSNQILLEANSVIGASEAVIWEFITVQMLDFDCQDWHVKWDGESGRWLKC